MEQVGRALPPQGQVLANIPERFAKGIKANLPFPGRLKAPRLSPGSPSPELIRMVCN